MTNRELLIEMVSNLNDYGIDMLLNLFGDCDKKEKYNINTTPERLAEMQKIEKHYVEKEEAKREADRDSTSYEIARKRYERQKDFKASLTGKDKRFFEVINSVKDTFGSRYGLECWELLLLTDTYGNNLMDGIGDAFWHGFIKGQRSERNKQKARYRQ